MPEPLLEVRALDAFYGDFQALFGVSLSVAPGEVVAVIGANGAGKSTLLNCIAGAMRSRRDAIRFEGVPIGDRPAHAVVARGIALVPEGRGLFVGDRGAGYRGGAQGGAPRLLPAGGPGRGLGRRRNPHARGDLGGLFRGVTVNCSSSGLLGYLPLKGGGSAPSLRPMPSSA